MLKRYVALQPMQSQSLVAFHFPRAGHHRRLVVNARTLIYLALFKESSRGCKLRLVLATALAFSQYNGIVIPTGHKSVADAILGHQQHLEAPTLLVQVDAML
jgi:hypothetical protein